MNHEVFAHLFFGVIKAPVVLMGAPSFDPMKPEWKVAVGVVGGGSQEVPVKSRLPCLGLALGNRLGEDEMLVGVSFCWVSCRDAHSAWGKLAP